MTTQNLLPEARLENLKRSLDVFIQDRFAAIFAAPTGTINYDGTLPPQEPAMTDLAEWIEPYLLGPARPEPSGIGRRGEDGAWMQTVVPIIHVNIFSRPRRQATAHRLIQLRDLVVDQLYPGMTVPVTDWANDNSALGAIVLRRVSMDQEMKLGPEYQDLEQWSYSVDGQWTERVRLIS